MKCALFWASRRFFNIDIVEIKAVVSLIIATI